MEPTVEAHDLPVRPPASPTLERQETNANAELPVEVEPIAVSALDRKALATLLVQHLSK